MDLAHNLTTILLDVDNTLLDFDEAERRGVSVVLSALGMEPSPERINRYHEINQEFWKAFERGEIPKEGIFGNRYVRFFSEMGRQIDGDLAEEIYREQLDGCSVQIPGAEEVCAYLKERYDLYVVTNGVAATQYRRLRDSGLDRFFTRIFVSEEIGFQKPSREYFEYCFQYIREKDRSRMMIVGDSLSSDILGGRNVGIVTCWMNPQHQMGDCRIRPDYEIGSLQELKGGVCRGVDRLF